MKKKSLIALLALITACMLVLTACGEKAATHTDVAEQTTQATQPEAELSSVTYERSPKESDELSITQIYTFYYDDRNIVKKAISEWSTDVSEPDNAKEGLEYLFDACKGREEEGIPECSYTQDGSIHTLRLAFDLTDEDVITAFASTIFYIKNTDEPITLEEIEKTAYAYGMVRVEPGLNRVTYEYAKESDEENGTLRYTFYYDESNTVKKAIVEWSTDVSKPGNVKEGLDHLYSEAQSEKGATGVYEYSYTQDGDIHTLRLEFDLTDELAITTFKSGFLHIYTDGETVTLEAIESAADYAGYVKIEA